MTISCNMARLRNPTLLPKDPLWYKDAIVYEVHVRAFLDSDADGIGDFPGLTQKLDYLQDLGVTAIWLLPFYPSPLKDDGYDIAEYYSINPIYGTLRDFKVFLEAAHQRGLRVITELVVNHTSDQHPWFQRARRSPPGSVWRDFYVWSDTSEKYKEARIIFRDFEPSNWTWDREAQAYYWHRFYSHQPDLNYDNPAVHREITRVMDFWFDLGVDGLRLDAVPYLYEREGTSCENLPETHQFLKQLRKHVEEKYGDRMLLAEANQWPEDSVAYLGGGSGDECHMAFHFPLMPRLFMAVRMEDRVPILDILEQTPAIPENSQWAVFLRNHDELTLEMVTDEERDYMYRVYANDAKARINLGIRRRLAPLLGNDRRRIELLNLLLFSYPGTPFLYYGDEIGLGDNIYLGDRNGVRTPMQWSSDKNAGFSRAHPHALYFPIILDPEYHYEAVNVEAQKSNPHSLWWWTKRVLALRKRHRAFGRGNLKFVPVQNRKVLAFTRSYEDETILVVANLSRFSQPARLDLAEYSPAVPQEMFGRTLFPPITNELYLLTLAPHAAMWLLLKQSQAGAVPACSLDAVLMSAPTDWEEVLRGGKTGLLENCLADWVKNRRWFGGKNRIVRNVQVVDSISVARDGQKAFILLFQLDYVEGDPEVYTVPITFAPGPAWEQTLRQRPDLAIARIRAGGQEGGLVDASGDQEFCQALFRALQRRRSFPAIHGEARTHSEAFLRTDSALSNGSLEPRLALVEQSNTSVVFGDRYFLKLFRKVAAGIHPDLEVSRFLTRKGFRNTPRMAGSVEYHPRRGEPIGLGILTEFTAGAQDAWAFTLDALDRYFDRARTLEHPASCRTEDLLSMAGRELTQVETVALGTYLEAARLLGQRTAEMHLVLASDAEDRDFAPEPFTPFYQRSLYQSMRNLAVQNFDSLRTALEQLPPAARSLAGEVLKRESQILAMLRKVHEVPVRAKRIRGHGDLHLGQVLSTGKDFLIIDFEGEPARPLGERRLKRSPFRDVTGMLRSFDYATHAALARQQEMGLVRPEHVASLRDWARFWERRVSAVYLKGYLAAMGDSDLLPPDEAGRRVLLDAYLLDKAIYEAGYELNNRPSWVTIPLSGILQLCTPASS